jgi:hypothetical protein
MNAQDAGTPACNPEALHCLLRGEIAAVETYDHAIGQFERLPTAAELTRIRDDHQRAVVALRGHADQFGCTADEDAAGAWGAYANAVGAVGPAAVLAALKHGEVHAANEYEAVLGDPDVDTGCKDLIRSDLLPRALAHVVDLDHLLAGTA